MKRIIPMVFIGFFVAVLGLDSVWGDTAGEEQNKKIEALQTKLVQIEQDIEKMNSKPELESRVKKIEDFLKGKPKKSSSGLVSAQTEERIQALEKEITELQEKIKQNAASVEAGKGTLKVDGILQVVGSSTEDPAAAAKINFTLKRARIIFSGAILPDRVNYFFQTEMAAAPALLDAKILFSYVPKTEIAVGRFVPAFTYYMPRSTAKLDFINYPLMVTTYGMSRQVGMQSTTKVGRLDLIAGIFNGDPANNSTDINTAKDLLLATNLRLADYVTLLEYSWQGNVVFGSSADSKKERYGGGLIFEKNITAKNMLTVKGEFTAGFDRPANGIETKSMSYYSQAGVRYNQKIEFLVRYDVLDPDINLINDGSTWITGGLNYYLASYNTMFYLNYINKAREKSPDPRENEVLAQAQLFF
jgi:hypothetical protein